MGRMAARALGLLVASAYGHSRRVGLPRRLAFAIDPQSAARGGATGDDGCSRPRPPSSGGMMRAFGVSASRGDSHLPSIPKALRAAGRLATTAARALGLLVAAACC